MAIHYPNLEAGRPGHLGAGQWRLRSLRDITVLFGKNGAGKSALLKALYGADHSKRHLTAPERAGDFTYTPQHAQEEATGAARAGHRVKNLMPDFRQRAVARLNTFFTTKGFHQSDAFSNAEFEDLMNSLMPDFVFSLKRDSPFYDLHRQTGGNVQNVEQLSSGEAEIFSLGVDLLTICALWKTEGQTGGLLLIDEPDTHLHPDLHHHLADFLTKLVEVFGVQIIVATHSTTLLSALGHHGQEKTSIIYLNRSEEEFVAVTFDESLQRLATCLGGHALMGPLFAFPLLLVEGDDDYKIWAQAVRHHVLKLAVIPCGGEQIDQYHETLEKIFRSIRTPAVPQAASAFVLKDRDEGGPINHDQSANFVHVYKLQCHESENLYLAAEVLAALGISSWDDAKAKILAEAPRFGAKQALLEVVATTADRKAHDVKSVISQLQEILDPKSVPWQVRVGKVIGAARPTGELLDYLGQDVVTALWGPDEAQKIEEVEETAP